uniref:Solute carrier family 25 member 14 n=1 Tax=Pavo cristatus TaxID=9049 RepID=A0A8C9FZQ3_PAVCR
MAGSPPSWPSSVRHVPRGPDQDAPAGAGPERRCAVPRGALPRHVPRPVPHLPRGRRPRPLLGVSTEPGGLRGRAGCLGGGGAAAGMVTARGASRRSLQVQGQSADARFREVRYRGMFHALFRICREEGGRALYSGIAPALLRQASYGTIKIGIYQSLKRLFVERLEDETLLINVICGVVSGVISSALANPTDVLKIRMQAQGSLFQGGMIGSFIDIYQQEGTRGLWRGVVPTAQRAAIVVGVELPVYDITKKHLILSGLMGDTIFTHFVRHFSWRCCSASVGFACCGLKVTSTRPYVQGGD